MMSYSYDEFLEYNTRAGDTFDSLAMDLYDNERMASVIMDENPQYCDVLIFDANITLFLPVIEVETSPDTIPPWR